MLRTLFSAALLLCALPFANAEHPLTIRVFDSDSKEPIASRVYLTSQGTGQSFFFESTSAEGSAVRYEKQNWINKASTEYHTTISAHPASASVPSGTYDLIVEHGKTYFSHHQTIRIEQAREVAVPLRRWVDPAERGWFSGDLHIHRSIEELRTIVQAEDLNVVFPLTQWVTLSDTPPSAGDKNLTGQLPDQLVQVDEEHVIWPLSTEYEIFSVGGQRHTLGALFVLGHEKPLQSTVPPWKPVIDSVSDSEQVVLFDLDKVAWPFAMTLPTIAPHATYELANNHMWRTDFAFRDWYTPTPNFMQPPFGDASGNERDWIDFTWGMYYTLLNAGFRLPPSAGTANGVHPVPAGFGRVYVQLPDGFDYEGWKKGLQAGRSFVTTGPMVYATAEGHSSGHTFEFGETSSNPIELSIEVISEQPITFGEVVVNGSPEYLLRVTNQPLPSGAYRNVIRQTIEVNQSGWFAIRFFEDRPDNRVRFAHTAPWYVEVNGEPVRPSWQERDYLVRRMTDEIQRSRGVVSAAALEEYERALSFYRSLEIRDDQQQIAKTARPLQQNRERWLRNMIVDHRFDASEVRSATGLSIESAQKEINRLASERVPSSRLRVLPYPGGRHPRRGFLDGAIDPQRDTKISVFPPWEDGGYAVIDVPEAIFSNLGLTYLAHTHIPTIWSERAIQMDPIEWKRTEAGHLTFERKLPNGIRFGSDVHLDDEIVRMEMWLHNGTAEPLTGLRSQVCVMLKGLVGFQSKRRRDPVVRGPFIAIQADEQNRWLITGWEPNQRAWANPPVPCVHSDPIFPDCAPGETVRVHGTVCFVEGDDIDTAIKTCERILREARRKTVPTQ